MSQAAANETAGGLVFERLESRVLLDAGPMIVDHWPASGVSGSRACAEVTLDDPPPAAPIELGIDKDTGSSDDDGLTDSGNFVLSWTPVEGVSVIVGWEHRIDGGEWVTVAETSAVVTATEGEHLLEVRAIDEFDRRGEIAQLTVTVDTTPPATPENLAIDHATFKWSESTDVNGIWKYRYRINGGDWRDALYGPPVGLRLAPGVYTFDVQALDHAGNISAATAVLELTDPITGRWVPEATFHLPEVYGDETDYGYSACIEGDIAAVGTLDRVLVYERDSFGSWLQTASFEVYPGGAWSSLLNVHTAIDNATIVAGTLNTVLVLERDADGIWRATDLDVPLTCLDLDISGDEIIVSDKVDWGGVGAVIYTRQEDGTWVQTDIVRPEGTDTPYGPSVALDGDLAVMDDARLTNHGGIYIFERGQDGEWRRVEYLFYGMRTGFGEHLAADDGVIAISGPGSWVTGKICERSDTGEWRIVSDLRGYCGVAMENETIVTASGTNGTWITVRDAGGAWIDVAQIRAPGGSNERGAGTDGERVIIAGEYDVVIYTFDPTDVLFWSDFREGTDLELELGLAVDSSEGGAGESDGWLSMYADKSVTVGKTLSCEKLVSISFDYKWESVTPGSRFEIILGDVVFDTIEFPDPEPARGELFSYSRTFNLADFGLSPGDLQWEIRLVNPSTRRATLRLDDMLLETRPTAMLGDADLDGDVSLDDLFAVRNNFGTQTGATLAQGDTDGDGDVDLDDLFTVRNNFGRTTIVVPEPATLSLLALGGVALLRRRR